MMLLRVLDVYAETSIVSRDDYHSQRTQIPLRYSTGRKFADSPDGLVPDCTTIHRNNIETVVSMFAAKEGAPLKNSGIYALAITDEFIESPERCEEAYPASVQCCLPKGHGKQSEYAHECVFIKSDEAEESTYFLVFAKPIGEMTVLHTVEVSTLTPYHAIVGAMMHLRQEKKGDYLFVDVWQNKPDLTLIDGKSLTNAAETLSRRGHD